MEDRTTFVPTVAVDAVLEVVMLLTVHANAAPANAKNAKTKKIEVNPGFTVISSIVMHHQN